jgi:hypothetical protein
MTMAEAFWLCFDTSGYEAVLVFEFGTDTGTGDEI